MRVLIIGSGATGGFIGARLLEKAIDVSFLVRPERKMQLLTRGLRLRSPFGEYRRPVNAITADEINGAFDLVVPAVRAQLYEEGLLLAATAIGPRTTLMPVIEGARHMENPVGSGPLRMIGAVLEARTSIDADGILTQRTPAAELHIGALREGDERIASELAEMFAGRGLKVIESDRVRAACWERFTFLAAGVATAHLKGRPLRDAVRFIHGPGYLQATLKEGHRIGTAAGFAPDMAQIGKYERAFTLVGRPVLAPPSASEEGAASDEAIFILSEMVGFARRARIRDAYLLNKAWDEISRPKEITLPATDFSSKQG